MAERYKVTFKDFSERFVFKWFFQALFHKNVRVYWDQDNKAWCRQVDNIECVIMDDWYVPLPGQFISYRQFILNRKV